MNVESERVYLTEVLVDEVEHITCDVLDLRFELFDALTDEEEIFRVLREEIVDDLLEESVSLYLIERSELLFHVHLHELTEHLVENRAL